MDYKKVIEDYRNGVIDKEEWQVTMDNDGGYWEYIGGKFDDLPEEAEAIARDAVCGEMDKKYGLPDGYGDVVDILVAAGVTSDWC